MAVKKNRPNRRKTSTGNRPIITLIVVAVILCAILVLLEWLKSTTSRVLEQKPPIAQEERHKLPARQSYNQIELQPYTSAMPEHKPQHKKKPVSVGTVAIIVDDMGTNLQEAKALMAINVPLTFSLIPGLPKVREVDKLASERGYQVMIHIPMEPKGYPKQRLEENGILLSQTDAEIEKRLGSYFKQVPHAAGANNHMGSRFSEDDQKMRLVLNQLKARSLFFVDSRTTPDSVGLSLARSMEVYAAGRNVFLDNTQDVPAITAQLEQLAALARKKGSAIGICHPHKTTIQALAIHLPRLKKEGIIFVPAGDLVR
ncbi:divergent polysaccharide deacetylase family protein [Geobacter pelophilus]|uniref:Divergent polysaccharide deacetylase family protein n=1 Tax=Geoanaerobacter pelophilus TaxID=60036 RepID=A0AAW4LEY5_9BACT|nr:divergent polysaccharide deacetylase family protein [Geoanaerobacter pelophilus]MBT0666564.1 divergent polysaccharide deacetylase family protein [Geoanaerobacter pelophilus]